MKKKKDKKLVTISEASEITKIPDATIRLYIKTDRLRSFGDSVAKVYVSEVEEVRKTSKKKKNLRKDFFDNMILKKGDSLRPFNCFRVSYGGATYAPLKYKVSRRYMVSYYGRIFDIDYNNVIELKQYKNNRGYMRVSLAQFSNSVLILVHRIVALIWCDNKKNKPYVHHIDGDPSNNKADNLVWVTRKEHNAAHELLDAAKVKKDFAEYNNYISQIKTDNYCEENYYCLLEYPYGEGYGFMFITERAYQDIKRGKYDIKHVPQCETRGFYYDRNEFFAKEKKKVG